MAETGKCNAKRRVKCCVAPEIIVIKSFMQISRPLLLACAAAICFTPALLHAYDNEAQLRARQALEDKMKELDTQQAATNAAPPPAATTTTNAKPSKKSKSKTPEKPQPSAEVSTPPAQKPAPPAVLVTPGKPPEQIPPAQPAPQVQKPAMTPPPSVSAAPTNAQPAMPAPPPAVSQPAPAMSAPPVRPAAPQGEKPAMATPPVVSQPPATSAPPAQPAAPQAKKPTMTPPAASAPVYSGNPTAPSGENEATEKERLALQMKMKESQAQPASTNATSQPWTNSYNPPVQTQHVTPTPPVSTLPPLTGPPSSLSAAKQQKLDQLLQLYRADQITPQEYHAQRAKILSEP